MLLLNKIKKDCIWKTLFLIFMAFLIPMQCSRIENSTENLRPKIHFTSKKNWINDPNGLIAINGNFHMYYQHNPFGNNWGHMSWGHAVSRNLYSWKEESVALHEKGYFFYPRMKFSGSAVLDTNNTSGLCKINAGCLIAIYTEWTFLNQTQNIAVSHDEGISFVEYQGNPVIDEKSWSFRDPKVFWHEKTSNWIMAVAKPSAKKVSFYSSKNLKNWEHLSDFSAKIPESEIWECPDLFYLPLEKDSKKGKWVLILSVAETPKGSFMKYFIGDFDGKKFQAIPDFENGKILDHGFDFYAAISWENLKHENRIIIGWMNNWEYANALPTHPWKGSMSLPRKLSLGFENGKYFILQNPYIEITKYKLKEKTIEQVKLYNNQIRIPLSSDSFEFNADFSDITADEVGIRIIAKDEFATFAYLKKDNTLNFDRKNISLNEFDKKFASLSHTKAFTKITDSTNFKIIVDKTTIEIFAFQGEIVFSSLVFPKEQFSELEIYSRNGNAAIEKITLETIR